MSRPILHHIPVCPFSQRLEILLALKGQSDAVEFRVIDITKARDPSLLERTGGSTALPVLDTALGVLKESLVILDYLDEVVPGPILRRADPMEHAVERMLVAKEGPLTMAGYMFLMNRDQSAREKHARKLLGLFIEIDRFLTEHTPHGTFLFDEFGLAEAVFTPILMRFWFLDYYEGFDLPDTADFARVRRWRDACLSHPATQQTSREEVVKLYYDYALGVGNGAVPEGRARSSFVFEPHWSGRPWPPSKKYATPATDASLGLF